MLHFEFKGSQKHLNKLNSKTLVELKIATNTINAQF